MFWTERKGEASAGHWPSAFCSVLWIRLSLPPHHALAPPLYPAPHCPPHLLFDGYFVCSDNFLKNYFKMYNQCTHTHISHSTSVGLGPSQRLLVKLMAEAWTQGHSRRGWICVGASNWVGPKAYVVKVSKILKKSRRVWTRNGPHTDAFRICRQGLGAAKTNMGLRTFLALCLTEPGLAVCDTEPSLRVCSMIYK